MSESSSSSSSSSVSDDRFRRSSDPKCGSIYFETEKNSDNATFGVLSDIFLLPDEDIEAILSNSVKKLPGFLLNPAKIDNLPKQLLSADEISNLKEKRKRNHKCYGEKLYNSRM
ncbi:hypothetical protein SSS_08660 [Sarcoptes scabiei]|uniref:Uncharacterized protein n=1 Tax=Sarcoptes scabiei TaxID=52283 RepID=A0A834R1T0_SARSC|nr:hypothetical protein SSS_08660 [Sarcoptes scabiei]